MKTFRPFGRAAFAALAIAMLGIGHAKAQSATAPTLTPIPGINGTVGCLPAPVSIVDIAAYYGLLGAATYSVTATADFTGIDGTQYANGQSLYNNQQWGWGWVPSPVPPDPSFWTNMLGAGTGYINGNSITCPNGTTSFAQTASVDSANAVIWDDLNKLQQQIAAANSFSVQTAASTSPLGQSLTSSPYTGVTSAAAVVNGGLKTQTTANTQSADVTASMFAPQ
jgi:hypothetical protein